jgi:hypothetical protein
MIDHQGNNQTPRRVSVLWPIDPGDLAAVKRWVVFKCRGRTIEQLAQAFGVEPTKEAVVQRVTRAIPRDSRDAAVKICERELRRSERGPG